MIAMARLLRDLLAGGEPAVLITVTATKGSVPREAGTRMIVTGDESFGTVGGGRLEWEATLRARAMIEAGDPAESMKLPLGPEIGQCCGGYVALLLQPVDAALCAELEAIEQRERALLPAVLLFGAGHVGKALAVALAPLPLRVRWIDGRDGVFPKAIPDGVETVLTERALDEVEAAPPGAAFVVMSHSHALDSMICAAVLQRGDFTYLGLIGSRTKRAQFERAFRETGIVDDQIARLVCPIGGRLKDKRPPVIAALVAAELIQVLADRQDTAGEAA